MKNLDRAVRLFRALVESPVRVDSATVRSWHATQQAIQHSPTLLTELRALPETARNRVLAYAGEFTPLVECRTLWQLPDHPSATRFKRAVEEDGGTASHMDGGGLIAADTSDPLTCEHHASNYGGVRVDRPSLSQRFHHVDTKLPESLFLGSGLDPALCERVLIESIYKSGQSLNESRLFAGFRIDSPIQKYSGRISGFCKPKAVLGVNARLAEAVRLSGMATTEMLTVMEAGAPGVQPGGAVAGGGSNDRGGVAKDQPDARHGSPADSRNSPQEPQTPPTEHVPAQEQGAANNAIRLPDGTEVPMDTMRQAFGKMLHNMATQVEQGTVGGQPPPRGVDQADATGTEAPPASVPQQQAAMQQASQQAVGAQSDQQQPAQAQAAPPQDGNGEAQPQANGEAPAVPPVNGEAPPVEAPPANGEVPAPAAPAPAAPEAPAQPGEQPAVAPAGDPAVEQALAAAETGDPEALKQVQGMQGQMSDEQKQRLQALLAGQQAPAPAAPGVVPESFTSQMSQAMLFENRSKPVMGESLRDALPLLKARDESTILNGIDMVVASGLRGQPSGLAEKVLDWLNNLAGSRKSNVRTAAQNALGVVYESKMTKKGQGFVSDKISQHMKKGGKPQKQAIAIAMSQARKGGYKGAKKDVDEALRRRVRKNGSAVVKNVINFLRFAKGQTDKAAADTGGADKSRVSAAKLGDVLGGMISKARSLPKPPRGVDMEVYVNPQGGRSMWGKDSDDGDDLLRAAGHNIVDAGNMLTDLGWKVEGAEGKGPAAEKFFNLAGALKGGFSDKWFSAADRWAFGLGASSPRGGNMHEAIDETAKRELELWIDNTQSIYRQKLDIQKTLKVKVKRGKYNSSLAPKLWMYLVDRAAQSYVKEFGGSVRQMFPKPLRLALATELAREYEEDKYDGLYSESEGADYSRIQARRREEMQGSARAYRMTQESAGMGVWEPVAIEAVAAVLPEGLDYGSGEAVPGTVVMVIEQCDGVADLQLPNGDKVRASVDSIHEEEDRVFSRGELVEAKVLDALLESLAARGVKTAVIVAGPPASGQSYFIRNKIGPWVRAVQENVVSASLPSLRGLTAQVREDTRDDLCTRLAERDYNRLVSTGGQAEFETALMGEQFRHSAQGRAVMLRDHLPWKVFERCVRSGERGFVRYLGAPGVRDYYDTMQPHTEDVNEKVINGMLRDRTFEAVLCIGNTLLIDSAQGSPLAELYESCVQSDMDVVLIDLHSSLDSTISRGRLVGMSESQAIKGFNTARSIVDSLRIDPGVTRYARYSWRSDGPGPFDGEFVGEGKIDNKQAVVRTKKNIDGKAAPKPKKRKDIVVRESLNEAGPSARPELPKGYSLHKYGRKWRVFKGTGPGPQKKDTLKLVAIVSNLGQVLPAIKKYKSTGKRESVTEQLDTGQAAESESCAQGMKESGELLRTAREAIFKLTTNSLVQCTSMAQATGAKGTQRALEKAQQIGSGFLDDLKNLGVALEKANETMKGENGGMGGDNMDAMKQAQDMQAAPPVANGNGEEMGAPAAPMAPTPAPVAPTPALAPAAAESVDQAISALLHTDLVERIAKGEPHRSLNEALQSYCPKLGVRERVQVIDRLKSLTSIPKGATLKASFNAADHRLLAQVVPFGSLAEGLVDRTRGNRSTLASTDELLDAVKYLKERGKAPHLLLANVLGGSIPQPMTAP